MFKFVNGDAIQFSKDIVSINKEIHNYYRHQGNKLHIHLWGSWNGILILLCSLKQWSGMYFRFVNINFDSYIYLHKYDNNRYKHIWKILEASVILISIIFNFPCLWFSYHSRAQPGFIL